MTVLIKTLLLSPAVFWMLSGKLDTFIFCNFLFSSEFRLNFYFQIYAKVLLLPFSFHLQYPS